jgi:hypothetical protein
MMIADNYTKAGAERLARAIERHWRHGAVRVWAEPEKGLEGVWTVKSNLINGLPPGTKVRQASAY